jgi:adenylate kinase family enzyme
MPGLQNDMRKVLVIGSAGAGKSTFAKRLGDLLALEVIHLDALYWNRGWVETPKDEWLKKTVELLNRDSWIIDGNYSNTLELRFGACDTVIFLDIERRICLWRVVKRSIKYWHSERPDMAEGCPEQFNWEFMKWIWDYPRRTRPRVVELLRSRSQNKTVIWLRTGAEIEKLLTSLIDPVRAGGEPSQFAEEAFENVQTGS